MKVLAVAGNTPISNQALSILHAHEEVLVQPVGGAAEAWSGSKIRKPTSCFFYLLSLIPRRSLISEL
jgi:hypothetical protein